MNTIHIEDNNLYKNYDYLLPVLEATLKHEKVTNAIFSVVFVTADEIQNINKQYRQVDKVTDVISFAFEDYQDIVYNDIRLLGDIYICIDRMKDQAILYHHSEKRELSFLAVHGLLHLLGYDHMNKKDEEIMFSLQELILNDQNITR